ncbi:hypothetical protein BDU57DRAFT_322263 [Ampelomyces quisqualis]|uniref:Uncharacterized protein n=1 Tax=Ampelomyces quisqualis TaxID=50730 RepID=A0A6A5QH11_AMPQU|nr:hypothetical protein BDU57DRAFT_322263 [Ampelomyces quisqualis]
MQQSTLSHHAAIPFQDISNTNYTGAFHIPAPSDPWNWHRSRTPPEPRQQIIPDPAPTDESRSGPPSQDIPREPFARLAFGSPEPSTRESSMDIKTFILCAPAAAAAEYRAPAKHQSTGPPGDTQQLDWSEGSSLYTSKPNSASAESVAGSRIRRLTMGELQLEL